MEHEEKQLKKWREEKTFEKTLQGGKSWVFYEGPPTANGLPGAHHALARSFKDLYARFHSMQGSLVNRKAGWDCHGLPVELEAEKTLGLSNKQELLEFGVPEFNRHCEESVMTRVSDWEKMSERLGFWLDYKNAYMTMTPEYMEQVFGALKKLDQKGFLYKGKKVTPHCPRCETTLSSHELDYRDVSTKSAFFWLKLKPSKKEETLLEEGREGKANSSIKDSKSNTEESKSDEYLLVWTTTPWTLPSNVAVGVNPNVDYQLVDLKGKMTWVSKNYNVALEAPVKKESKGKDLLGKSYHPLYSYLKEAPYKTVAANFVSSKEGTGFVHLAPSHGAEDKSVFPDLELDVLVKSNGTFQKSGKFNNKRYSEVNELVLEEMLERGDLYETLTLNHSYPHCWRCKSQLLYMPSNSWYLRTTSVKDRMVQLNRNVNWYPESAGSKRFGNWLENNVDWSLSRQRFWGTPLPVWECENCNDYHVVGSRKELKKLTGVSATDLHRQSLDNLVFTCKSCKGNMKRSEDVLDVWFDSGCMPFAQFEGRENEFKKNFPADFVCEGLDQTRGWFYSLLAVSTMLYDRAPYKNVLCLGLLLDGSGEKMSKSKGNVLDVNQLFNTYGADRLRWFFYSSKPPWEGYQLDPEELPQRTKMLNTLESTLDFYNLYVKPYYNNSRSGKELMKPADLELLDEWLLLRLEQTKQRVSASLDDYDAFSAAKELELFVEQLSNWYLRLSRKRFWREDTNAFYTLTTVMNELAVLLAPLTPFLAEKLYLKPGSVHLAEWSRGTNKDSDFKPLLEQMKLVETVCSLGRSLRSENNVPLRQPLSTVSLVLPGEVDLSLLDLVKRELNVKEVVLESDSTGFTEVKVKLNYAALGPRLGSKVQQLREVVNSKAKELFDNGSAEYDLKEEKVRVSSDEVEFTLEARTGTVFKQEGQVFLSYNLTMTEELLAEGYYRMVLRGLQQARKDLGFNVSDRVKLTLSEGEYDLRLFSKSLKEELLLSELSFVQNSDGLRNNLKEISDLRFSLEKA